VLDCSASAVRNLRWPKTTSTQRLRQHRRRAQLGAERFASTSTPRKWSPTTCFCGPRRRARRRIVSVRLNTHEPAPQASHRERGAPQSFGVPAARRIAGVSQKLYFIAHRPRAAGRAALHGARAQAGAGPRLLSIARSLSPCICAAGPAARSPSNHYDEARLTPSLLALEHRTRRYLSH